MDDEFTSILVDEEDSDYSQEDLNEELLLLHDRRELIKCLSKRVTEFYLKFLVDNTDMYDIKYWRQLSEAVAREYYLNYLKVYKEGFMDSRPIAIEILQTIFYLKIKLIECIIDKKLRDDISIDEFIKFLEVDNAPKLVVECIRYSDLVSFNRFKSRIFREKDLDYTD